MEKSSVVTTAAEIRAEYKKNGWNSRMISVKSESYSMGSSIHVLIKSAKVDYAKAKEIASGAESISYDEITGEILSGGNRYVDVNYSSESIAAAFPELREKVAAFMLENENLDRDTGVNFLEITGASLFSSGRNQWTLYYDNPNDDEYYPSTWLSNDLESRVNGFIGYFWEHGIISVNDQEAPAAAATENKTEITKYHNDKRGFDFYMVEFGQVSREIFNAYREQAKLSGGWYSRKYGTCPAGFAFKDPAAAADFADFLKCQETAEAAEAEAIATEAKEVTAPNKNHKSAALDAAEQAMQAAQTAREAAKTALEAAEQAMQAAQTAINAARESSESTEQQKLDWNSATVEIHWSEGEIKPGEYPIAEAESMIRQATAARIRKIRKEGTKLLGYDKTKYTLKIGGHEYTGRIDIGDDTRNQFQPIRQHIKDFCSYHLSDSCPETFKPTTAEDRAAYEFWNSITA